MKPKSSLRFFRPTAFALVSFTLAAGSAQAQSIWANSNIGATPTATLDWLTSGTQATWTGGAPVSGSSTSVQFFQDATTALLNTGATGNTQTANLNNGASPFELGILTLSGKGSATSGAHLFESISGSDINFSGATGTINLNAALGTGNLAFQIGDNIRLGTASSASALTLTGGGGGAFFITGNISELQLGGGSLTKSGSSILNLSGNNTYTGTTTVSGGTLRLGSQYALPGGIGATGGTSALTLNGGVVELGADDFLRNLGTGASQFQITGGVSGFSTKGGVRNVIVNNDANQEIQWGSASFNPTQLTLGGGAADGRLTLQNKIDLNGATRTINPSGTLGDRSAVVISGVIRSTSGTAGLTKIGHSSSILKLTGANTFDGPVTISAGTLSVNSMADTGSASPLGLPTVAAASLVLNGGVLQYTGIGESSNRSFSLNASSTLDASGSGALNLTSTATPAYGAANAARTLALAGSNPGTNTLAAVITDNGTGVVSVTKSGVTGNWVLAGANTFTGAVTVSSGTLSISSIDNVANANPLGQSSAVAANLKLGTGTTLKYTGSGGSSDRSFTINGTAAGNSATIDASGSGALNLTSTSAIAYGTAAQTRTLTLTGTNTGNNTLSALIADNGALVTLAKAGQGTWVLNGPVVNTYTGATQVNTGTLVEDFGNMTSGYANLVNSGSALTLGGGTLSLKGHSSNASSQTFGNPTFSSQAGSGISLTGASGMTLTLGNTWTRSAGGTLNVTLGAGGTLTSTPAVDVSTPTPLVKGSGSAAFATVGGADWAKVSLGNVVGFTVSDYNTTFPASGATSTENYSLADSGSVTTTETANTLKINTTTSGQSLAITGGQALTLNAGGLLFTGANDYSITGGTLKGVGGTGELVVHQFGSGNLTISSALPTTTVLTKTGTGTLTLDGANTHTGNTYAGGGGTVVLKNQLALQSSALVVNNSNIVFDSSVGGNAFTLGGLSSPYAGSGYDIALQNNAGSPAAVALTVNVPTSVNTTYNGALSGQGSLIKTGNGTLTLSGFNTYTGGTTINGGSITAGANDDWFLGSGGPNGNVQVTVNTGGTLVLNANTITGTLTLNGGTLNTGNSFGSMWDGSIILQTTSTFSGSSGTIFVPAVISGTGGLIKTGTTGSLALMNANTFSGDTKITGSMLLLSHPLALQNSILDTTGSTATIAAAVGIRVMVNTLTLGGLSGNKDLSTLFTTGFGGSFNTNYNNPNVQTSATPLGGYSGLTAVTLNPGVSQTPSYTGIIADGAPGMSLVKTGLGTQTLSGANTYTGATIVSAGKLALGASDVLPNVSSVSIGAGTLDAATFTDTVGTLDVTAAATINLGGGALVFSDSSAVDWTGGTLNITGTLGATSLRFGTTSGGLTAGQLALITVNGGGSYILDANGYLVAGGNTPPTISDVINQSVPSGGNTGALSFTVGDAETAVGSLGVSGSSSNTTLVPNGNIVIGGSGASRTVTVTPVPGLVGTATITVTVTDAGSLTATDTFTLTVTENYLSWSTANGVTGGVTGDSDNDGVKNLVEYALVNGGERGVLSGNTITFTKRGGVYGSDVTYGIETSPDLVVWGAPGVGVTDTLTTISYTFTPSTPVKNFARLKVVQIP